MIIWTILKLKEDFHLYKQEIQGDNADIVKHLGKAGTDLDRCIGDVAGELKPNDILLTPSFFTIIPRKQGMLNN